MPFAPGSSRSAAGSIVVIGTFESEFVSTTPVREICLFPEFFTLRRIAPE
jgi:hypothetical protein